MTFLINNWVNSQVNLSWEVRCIAKNNAFMGPWVLHLPPESPSQSPNLRPGRSFLICIIQMTVYMGDFIGPIN